MNYSEEEKQNIREKFLEENPHFTSLNSKQLKQQKGVQERKLKKLETLRDIVDLRINQHKTLEEIAKIYGVTGRAIGFRFERSKKIIDEILREDKK